MHERFTQSIQAEVSGKPQQCISMAALMQILRLDALKTRGVRLKCQ